MAEATKMADEQIKAQQKTLAKQGYNREQIKSLTSMADRAYQSATVVKTLPQLMGVVKESIGSVWANAFSAIVGNFNQSKKMWTAAANSISNVIKGFSMSALSPWLQLHSQNNNMKVYGEQTTDLVAAVRSLGYTQSYWGI